MYLNVHTKVIIALAITIVANSLSMLPPEGLFEKANRGFAYLGKGLYHGTARTLLKNPLGICFDLYHLIIEKDFIKNNPGKTAGIATSLVVPILYNGFFENKIHNSLLQTLIDTPYHIGLAFQKLCFDRDYIHEHPWRSSFVAANLIFTFARNYREFNKDDGLEEV